MLNQFYKDGMLVLPNVLLKNYKHLNISGQAFVLLIALLYLEQKSKVGIQVTTLQASLEWQEDEVYNALSELMEAKLISFEWVEENKKQHERISLEPLFQRLESYYAPKIEKDQVQKDDFSLVQAFEHEFGRSLSQIELSQIVSWRQDDKFSDQLIHLALSQAVINQAFSLKYIDRILFSWAKKNIRTVEEAKNEIDSFNQKKSQYEDAQSTVDVTDFWLPKVDW